MGSASTAASPFAATLALPNGSHRFVDLRAAAGDALATLPWCLRVLLENALRDERARRRAAALDAILRHAGAGAEVEIPFRPRRILMHDTTCGPALVDIAAMRDVIAEHGGDPASLSPICPVATSTDHSVGVDRFGPAGALADNMRIEIGRNAERYRFMKWAAGNLGNFRVFPPGTGIMHTINLEHLTPVVAFETIDGEPWVLPDTLLGTDSHTPMINAVGVLGWGVGGLEAEGAMFGLPLALRLPEVVGVRLTGRLRPGVLGTDVALTVTELLRGRGVVGKFVEFFGPGVAALSVGERGADRQHGAGVRRHDRLLPARRAGPRLSARDRPRPRPAAGDRGLRPPAGLLARAGPDAGLRQHARARSRQGRAVAGGPEAAAGPAAPGAWPRPRSAGRRTSRTT